MVTIHLAMMDCVVHLHLVMRGYGVYTSGYEGLCGAFTSVMRGCVVPLYQL